MFARCFPGAWLNKLYSGGETHEEVDGFEIWHVRRGQLQCPVSNDRWRFWTNSPFCDWTSFNTSPFCDCTSFNPSCDCSSCNTSPSWLLWRLVLWSCNKERAISLWLQPHSQPCCSPRKTGQRSGRSHTFLFRLLRLPVLLLLLLSSPNGLLPSPLYLAATHALLPTLLLPAYKYPLCEQIPTCKPRLKFTWTHC